jgi:MoaA/NifB/PqqE/SkfB family radical SAM enzyme
MKIRRHIKNYNFIGDTESGVTFRWGRKLQDNPSIAPWAELADISISNHCTKGCDYCYRNSQNNNSFMSLDEYEYILNELQHPKWGNVFQVAIGGGEPLEHPQLKDIIETTLSHNIIPNLTTNGVHLSSEYARFLKNKIGAIAISVSDMRELDMDKISILRAESIRTNVHYVLSSRNVSQAVEVLMEKFNSTLSGFNSIIFLTHKPHGRASTSDTLKLNDDLKQFISLIDRAKLSTRIGFDACFVPHLLHFTDIDSSYVASCECGFFSIYIDENLNVKPCSFDNSERYTFNLKEYSFRDIWENKLQEYRVEAANRCKRDCTKAYECRGACNYYEAITCCFSPNKETALHV